MLTNSVAFDLSLREEAFLYKLQISSILKNSKVLASSSWMMDLPQNTIDSNINSNWRANRIAWGHEDTYIGLDFGRRYLISRLVWINGFGNSTPQDYSVEVSDDSVIWKKIKEVKQTVRIDDKRPQVVSFPAENVRYIRMNLKRTLDQDAPQIAEIWPVPAKFDNLDIAKSEEFLGNPFGYVPTKEDYMNTIS